MRKKIKDKIQMLKESENGITSFEVAIACIIFIIVFAAFVDVVLLAQAHIATTTVTKDLARTISVQGGAWDAKPEGYTENYYTLSDLQSMVKTEMENAGIEDADWAVYIKDEGQSDYYSDPLLTATEARQYTADYLSSFSVKIEARYTWRLFGNIMGLPVRSTLNISMPGLSEWKYDYGSWEEG